MNSELKKELPPIGYLIIGAVCSALLLWAYDGKYMKPYDYGFGTGFATGYKQGKLDALSPIATNNELQEVCLSLWISEQIRGSK